MSTQPPPPRYRVVEQGRRLVVIDAATGAPPARKAAPTEPPPASGLTRTAFDGRATLVTRAIYDAKGPRTLTLSGGEVQTLNGVRVMLVGAALMLAVLAAFFPWLLLAPLAFTDRRVRRGLRAAVTRWLDRYDTPSAG